MDFDRAVAEHRAELLAHCYRMLGSSADAEDVLQEALIGAWKGRAGFEGRSSVRTWLYAITTNACLKHARRRWSTPELVPALDQTGELGTPDTAHAFVSPFEPSAEYLRKESVELAYVTAMQRLPATQRAVLILREVLSFSAAEVAGQLGTTPAAVNSALQRARATLGQQPPSQQEELAFIGSDAVRALVAEFSAAWQAADTGRLAALLTEDARFTMPPLPAWFDGRAMVLRFLAERVFATPWRLTPITVNAQPGYYCEQQVDGVFRPGAVNVLSLRNGRVSAISGFVDPDVVKNFALRR